MEVNNPGTPNNGYPTPNYPTSNNTPNPNSAPPENYLVWAILTTCLCCLPLGIVSIVKSTEVNNKWYVGDHAGAYKASQDAKKYAIISAIVGPVLVFIYIFFILGISTLSAMAQ